MKKLILSVILLCIACTETPKKNTTTKKITTVTEAEEEKPEVRFVSAEKGLIYRTKPKGKRLGKIPFETEVTILEHSGTFQKIKTKEGLLEGEWVQVMYKKKKVYIFDGYLTNSAKNSLDMDFDEAKTILQNGIWVASEFRNLLERTNLYSSAAYYKYSPHNIIFHGDNKVELWSENQMEVSTNELDKKFEINSTRNYKISALNDTIMTLSYNDMKFDYFKIDHELDTETDMFHEISKGTDITLKKWFKGTYLFKKGDVETTIKFDENSELIFHAWYTDYDADILVDIIGINNDRYLINQYKDNTYFLDKIKIFEDSNKPEAVPTGEKATLTKIK